MKSLIGWLFVSAMGFILMAFSYFNYQYDAGPAPWKDAFMYIGREQPGPRAEDLEYVKRPVRLLPIARRARNFTQITRNSGPYAEKFFRLQFQEKVVLYPEMAADFTGQMLEWGRFVSPGAEEAVAGSHAENKDKITVDGRTFKVVGQLKKSVGLFASSYLIGDDTTAGELFDPDNKAVQNAYIFLSIKEQSPNPEMNEQHKKAFPKPQFVAYTSLNRVRPGPYYLYVVGMALLFLGGSVVFIKLYCFLAGRIGSKWLRPPLAEIKKYKNLFLTMHLLYFGAVVLCMLLVYLLPELQVCILAVVKGQITSGSGPLGAAGKAYMSGSILRAAVTTFAINFPLGSVICITLPSVIVPGAGVLVAGLRAAVWGLVLAPTFESLSGIMLPHSFTLLLEGEAYILAAFFGLLILVYLFRTDEGPSLGRRYGKALMMNVRGNLLVAIVLVIAAIYEAIEVILAM